MNKLLRAGFAVALCTGAAACAEHKPAPVVEAPPPPPAPPAPAPVTMFDGVYRGAYARAKDSAKSCSATHHGTVRVMNGTFSAAVSRTVSFPSVTVAPDGTFSSTAGDETLQGAIADGKLTGKLDGSTCHYTVSMTSHAMSPHEMHETHGAMHKAKRS